VGGCVREGDKHLIKGKDTIQAPPPLNCWAVPTTMVPGVTTSSAKLLSACVTSSLWLAHHASRRSMGTPTTDGNTASCCLQPTRHSVRVAEHYLYCAGALPGHWLTPKGTRQQQQAAANAKCRPLPSLCMQQAGLPVEASWPMPQQTLS
jgi:hypothetical protein